MSLDKFSNVERKAFRLVLHHCHHAPNSMLDIQLSELVEKALRLNIDESWLAEMLDQDCADKISERVKRSLH